MPVATGLFITAIVFVILFGIGLVVLWMMLNSANKKVADCELTKFNPRQT